MKETINKPRKSSDYKVKECENSKANGRKILKENTRYSNDGDWNGSGSIIQNRGAPINKKD